MQIKLFRANWHCSFVLEMKRKSSNTLMTVCTCSLFCSIHFSAVEKASNLLQDEAIPCGRHLS